MEQALLYGIRLFNQQQFFVCHEVLEEIWQPERSPRRFFLQSLIHLAVGFYHSQKGNPAGAERQLRKGLGKLAGYLPVCEGIDTARLYRESLARLEELQHAGQIGSFPTIELESQ
jgi:predicted metal-dependent hydrolase